MGDTDNVKKTLFDYVKNNKKWFYWYHHPERLKELYIKDHTDNSLNKNDYFKYFKDKHDFTKRVWRFENKRIEFEGKTVVIEKDLADFFDAVLDEERIKNANAFADYALYISDNDDLSYFRDTVTKREISADIDYDRQRDHAVHTLYNYLLGWYIFEHSEKLREGFLKHLKNKLNIECDDQKNNLQKLYEGFKVKIPAETNISISLIHEFADVWPVASLLHDIGYILEGSISSASPEVENLRVTNGSKIIHDYFNHYFWKSFEVDFRVAKNIAKTLGVVVPDFRYSRSLASLGDHLCDIGSCENIRKDIWENHKDEKHNKDVEGNKVDKDDTYKSIESLSQEYGLNREAFSIWKEHYEYHGSKKMADILYVVERIYRNMMWVGSVHGKRNLDHGVCSGLITLQALTFFLELYFGFRNTEWSPPEAKPDQDQSFSEKQKKQPLEDTYNRVSKQLFIDTRNEIIRIPKRIRIRYGDDTARCKLRSDFWFKKILWATAASAIHSIIQQPEYKKQCRKHKDKEQLKIGLDDDPLAFLGILVDKLQEWDRYKVSGRGGAAFSNTKLLQSSDVCMGINSSDRIDYNESRKGAFSDIELSLCHDIKIDVVHSGVIYLKYPKDDEKDWAKKLNNEINDCLENDWMKIVEILPNS